jgi:hypothetical protein
VLFALPAERPRAERTARGHWREALTRRLAPYYAGIFVLHLTLTAAFIAVPHVLRDLHGLEESRHWLVYLGVFVASIALTAPLVVWSERNRSPGRAALIGGGALFAALAALAVAQESFDALLGALVLYFGAFNFLEARLPAALTEAAGEASRDLPVRGRLRGRPPRGRPARKPLAGHRNFRGRGGGRPRLAAVGKGDGICAKPCHLTVRGHGPRVYNEHHKTLGERPWHAASTKSSSSVTWDRTRSSGRCHPARPS